MTIAPLPLGVLAAAGATGSARGSSSESSESSESSDGDATTPDAFAALVAAVLAAGAPAAAPTAVTAAIAAASTAEPGVGATPTSTADATTDAATDPTTDATTDGAVDVTLSAVAETAVMAEPAHPSAPTSATRHDQPAEPAHPSAPTGAASPPLGQLPPGVTTVAVDRSPAGRPGHVPTTAGVLGNDAPVVVPVVLPVVLPPALAAALDGTAHPTAAAATPSGEQVTVPAPAPVEPTPPAPASTASGEHATDPASQTVDHAPPAPAAGTDQPRLTPAADPQAAMLVQAASTTATTSTADRPVTPVPPSAAAQVVPELTRLVQAGPGTHRMVLRLDPEHLGDVRITLTVHPGGVRVRMATGSEDARATLHEGLPALQRALESMTGRPAGETQLSVLHQSQQSSQQSGQQSGSQADPSTYDGDHPPSSQTDAGASDHRTPGERPQAEHRDAGRPAGTQVETTARDGSQGAGTPRPADPPTSDASRRLDVSM